MGSHYHEDIPYSDNFIQELQSFEKAMKDETFRKLLLEYAHEIQDPVNKKVNIHVTFLSLFALV